MIFLFASDFKFIQTCSSKFLNSVESQFAVFKNGYNRALSQEAVERLFKVSFYWSMLYFLLGTKMNSHRHVERFKWDDIKRARNNGHSIASVKTSSLHCSFPVPQKSFFVTIKILCRAHVTKMFTAQQMHYLKVYPALSSVCSTALHTVIWIHHLL